MTPQCPSGDGGILERRPVTIEKTTSQGVYLIAVPGFACTIGGEESLTPDSQDLVELWRRNIDAQERHLND